MTPSRFCLKFDDRFSLESKEFERINQVPVQVRIIQYSGCSAYKFVSKDSPIFFGELFFQWKKLQFEFFLSKIKCFSAQNIGVKSLSYTGPSLWNNLNKNLEITSNNNNFKCK